MMAYNPEPMALLLAAYAFAVGAIVGSFLNVVIHRYPRGESIVAPASRCASCGKGIRWYDNIPIISWLALRGRCRNCGARISSRYLLVELASGLFYLAIWLDTANLVHAILIAAIVSMTIVLIYIDLEIQILPDVIDLPGIALGIGIGALGLGREHPELVLSSSLADSIAGALFGGGMLLAVALIYKRFRGIEGMGMGDVKMLAMIGAVVGVSAVLPVLLVASITGTAFGIWLGSVRQEGLMTALPFGVFLGLGTLIVIFFGAGPIAWWFRTIAI